MRGHRTRIFYVHGGPNFPLQMRLSSLIPSRLRLLILKWSSRAKRIVFGRNTDALLVRSRNGLLLVDVDDQYVGRHLTYEGEYGRLELERLQAVLSPSDNLLIVGAHIGAIAIPISHSCRSVTAIEANPRSFQLLQLNVAINRCENVHAVHIAASDKAEQLTFVASTVNSGGSKRMPVVHDPMYFYDSPQLITVQSARLDDTLRGMKFEIVLMDIEGSEYFALRGMQDILSYATALFVEFVPHHLRNVSNVTVGQFLAPIQPHFSRMFVPSQGCTVPRSDWCPVLQVMYDRNESDDGVFFSKQSSEQSAPGTSGNR
jgi:FkbM family methyltransferase